MVKAIGIIGGGTVGSALARAYTEYTEVRVYDIVATRATHTLENTLAGADLVFLCLPTPQLAGSYSLDCRAIDMFLAHYVGELGNPNLNLVLKSTVPIGTTMLYKSKYNLKQLVHSPEFLTARCAYIDAATPSRNIVGDTNPPGRYPYIGIFTCCATVLSKFYTDRYPGSPVLTMTSSESEAVKLFLNGFFAVKVAYLNEVFSLANTLGLDWPRIINGITSDGRVTHSHTQIPGPDGSYGFGGSCLPKDLAALVHSLDATSLASYVSHGALRRNQMDRRIAIS